MKTEQVKKKKSKGGQKLRLWVPPCVFIYENAIELWVMETELWKQSYRLAKQPFCYMGPTIFELWVIETENWVIKFGWPNSLLASNIGWASNTNTSWGWDSTPVSGMFFLHFKLLDLGFRLVVWLLLDSHCAEWTNVLQSTQTYR